MVRNQLIRHFFLEKTSKFPVEIQAVGSKDIAAQDPDDVGPVLISLIQKIRILGGVAGIQHAIFYDAPPGRQQPHIDPQLFRYAYNFIAVFPELCARYIAVYRSETVGLFPRQAVNQDCLDHIEPLMPNVLTSITAERMARRYMPG